VSVLRLTVVVKSADRNAAVDRYSALLGSELLAEFEIADAGLTVSLLPGLSILSGTESALSRANSLIASVSVDSLDSTKEQLVKTGWTIAGSLGSPRSLLAQDPDGSIMEFVELPDG
jgi:hypothetical protein